MPPPPPTRLARLAPSPRSGPGPHTAACSCWDRTHILLAHAPPMLPLAENVTMCLRVLGGASANGASPCPLPFRMHPTCPGEAVQHDLNPTRTQHDHLARLALRSPPFPALIPPSCPAAPLMRAAQAPSWSREPAPTVTLPRPRSASRPPRVRAYGCGAAWAGRGRAWLRAGGRFER